MPPLARGGLEGSDAEQNEMLMERCFGHIFWVLFLDCFFQLEENFD